VRHTEIPAGFVLRRAALLVADDRNDFGSESRKARDDCRVVAEGSVAMKLDEILE